MHELRTISCTKDEADSASEHNACFESLNRTFLNEIKIASKKSLHFGRSWPTRTFLSSRDAIHPTRLVVLFSFRKKAETGGFTALSQSKRTTKSVVVVACHGWIWGRLWTCELAQLKSLSSCPCQYSPLPKELKQDFP
jgi:hypothetical protein